MAKTKTHRQFSDKWPFFIVGALLLLSQARVLFSYAAHYTDQDQTLMWYAAKELIHGRLGDPNFYGQTYNTNFESIPGALLHLIGLPFGLSMPLSTMLLVTILWVILARIAYHNDKHKLALLALAIPLILRVQYIVLFDAPRGVMAGDLLAVLAIACALWWCKDNITKLVSLIALGGLAILWDYAAAFMIVPVFVYIIYKNWAQVRKHLKKTLLIFVISALPAIGWLVLQKIWYSTHPYDITAANVSIKPSISIFLKSIEHIDAYLAYIAPVLVPIAYLAVLLFFAFIFGLAYNAHKRKSKALFYATLSVIILFFLALALPRANAYQNYYYLSRPRLFLTLPVAIFLLLLLESLDKENAKDKFLQIPKVILGKSVTSLFVGFVIISFAVTQINFSSIMTRTTSNDLAHQWIISPSKLIDSCQKINRVYKATNAQLLATQNSNLAYGCAAQYSNFNTIVPNNERRGWVIETSYHYSSSGHNQLVNRLLIQGSTCGPVESALYKCSVETDGLLLIQTAPNLSAPTLAEIGLPVKDYTPPAN